MSSGLDWGNGAYEEIAPWLEASAEHLVRLAAPQPGERAIDLGCGSGNATLPLLRSGAAVTAIDPSLRLLGLASARAHDAGYQLSTIVAGAESLPLPDGDADLVVSHFGVIFCPDPEAAFSEIFRVLAPGGRLLFSAWLPTGPIAEVGNLVRNAANRPGEPPLPSPARSPSSTDAEIVVWHEPATFEHLVPGGAGAICTHLADAHFEVDSGEAWFAKQEAHHPMWLSAMQSMPSQTWAAVRAQSVALLDAAAPAGQPFAIASPYVVVEVRPQH